MTLMIIILINYYTSFPEKINLLSFLLIILFGDFLDSLSSHLFLSQITQTTRIRDSSKTLIDNIVSNTLIENIISENSTATISDHLPHLPQFIILPNIFSNPHSNESNISERD